MLAALLDARPHSAGDYEQIQRNVAGTAHDPYRCATSTVDTQIFSFDNGHYWWADDGHCAAEELKKQAQKSNDKWNSGRLMSVNRAGGHMFSW